MTLQGPGKEFLRLMGFSHNPFLSPVAEKELSRLETLETFLQYFTESRLQVGRRIASTLNLDQLRSNRNVIILGSPGAGKTTLRLALEAEYRKTIEKTLVVTLELNQPEDESAPKKDQYDQLAEALAIDLFVQVCEKYNPITDHPTPTQIATLGSQVIYARLSRVIEKMLDEPADGMPFGIAKHWSMIGKRAIWYIPPADELLKLLQNLLLTTESTPRPSGKSALLAGIKASRSWGFQQIIILVDTIDQLDPIPEHMFNLIRPLIVEVDFWNKKNVHFKYFLLPEVAPYIKNLLVTAGLRDRFDNAKIVWDQESLSQLISRRFEAAESRHTRLGALASEEAADRLDHFLLVGAKSPREVIERINFFLREIPRLKNTPLTDFRLEDVDRIEQKEHRRQQKFP